MNSVQINEEINRLAIQCEAAYARLRAGLHRTAKQVVGTAKPAAAKADEKVPWYKQVKRAADKPFNPVAIAKARAGIVTANERIPAKAWAALQVQADTEQERGNHALAKALRAEAEDCLGRGGKGRFIKW